MFPLRRPPYAKYGEGDGHDGLVVGAIRIRRGSGRRAVEAGVPLR